jgi:drug/metabolite transporter (DMT)-like permease
VTVVDAPPTPRRVDLPILASLVAVTAWGFGPLTVRGITASAPTIAFYRFAVAVPVFWAVAYLTGGRATWRLLRQALPPGLFFGASFITSFESFQRTSIANATLIGALTPVVIMPIAAVLMADRLGARRIALGAVAMVGVAITVLGASASSEASLDGDLLAVGTLLLFSGQLLLVKRNRDLGAHSWSFVAAVTTVGFMVVAPWSLALSDDYGAFGGGDWLLLAAMILGPGLMGHGLMTWAQGHIDASVTALLMLASPVISAFGAWVIFDQALSVWQIAGAGVVLAALGAVVSDNRRRR